MTSYPKLIAICGPARVGKDTFARFLCEAQHRDVAFGCVPYRVHRFAETIKDTGKLWFGWTDEHLEGKLKEVVDPRFGFSPREFMLKCGTEFARDMLAKDIWLKIFEARFGLSNIIIPDCRFPNEVAWVKACGGQIVHVQRANFTPNTFGGHQSAQELPRAPEDWITLPCLDVDAVKAAAIEFHLAMMDRD